MAIIDLARGDELESPRLVMSVELGKSDAMADSHVSHVKHLKEVSRIISSCEALPIDLQLVFIGPVAFTSLAPAIICALSKRA